MSLLFGKAQLAGCPESKPMGRRSVGVRRRYLVAMLKARYKILSIKQVCVLLQQTGKRYSDTSKRPEIEVNQPPAHEKFQNKPNTPQSIAGSRQIDKN